MNVWSVEASSKSLNVVETKGSFSMDTTLYMNVRQTVLPPPYSQMVNIPHTEPILDLQSFTTGSPWF